MDAIELTGKRVDGVEVVVNACGKCGVIAVDKPNADACCKPRHCACGKEIGRWEERCPDCQRTASAGREQARRDKATRIPHSQYGAGMLLCDCCDKFFDDLESLFEAHAACESVPTWAWATIARKFAMDAEETIKDELERQECFEDACDWIPDDLAELQLALDKVADAIPPTHESAPGVIVTFEDEAKGWEAQRKAETPDVTA